MSLDVHFSEPEEFNCSELHSCIADVAKLLGIDNFEYNVDVISGDGNYVANVFEVVIKDIGNENKSVSVIVKTLVNTERRETFRDFHKREVIVYNEVIPKYKELQTAIKENKRIQFPECLYTNASKNKEVIILKDLRDIGFGINDIISKFDEPSFKQTKLIMTELAKFHALSFVYERKEKENFNKLKLKLDDFLFQESFLSKTKLRSYFSDSYDMSLKLVMDIEAKKKLDKIGDELMKILRMYCKPSKYNVLCHGDLWINNILFKQANEGNEICFLDFQVSRYCCPVTDIIHFIYLTTTSKFRSDYFMELQNAYYNSLDAYLKLFDIEANCVYPREEFEKDLVENLPYGLIEAMLELRIVTIQSHEEQELLDDSDEISITSEVPNNHLYEFRVNDVVQESINNGVLEKLLKLVDGSIE